MGMYWKEPLLTLPGIEVGTDFAQTAPLCSQAQSGPEVGTGLAQNSPLTCSQVQLRPRNTSVSPGSPFLQSFLDIWQIPDGS